MARSADAPAVAASIHNSPSNPNTALSVGHCPMSEGAEKFTQPISSVPRGRNGAVMSFGKHALHPPALGDSSAYILVAEWANEAPPMCFVRCEVRRVAQVCGGYYGDVRVVYKPIPVLFQVLLVDCSTDSEEPLHIAASGIIYAHRDAPLSASLRSSAAARVPKAAQHAGMNFESNIPWMFA
ncbi:hypothetical protein B0H19DRAFT_1057135 [Mycena capillaripes]|nr:hypothetical protein B0H19DRAFT_1057135 [Mycena capillaripes]